MDGAAAMVEELVPDDDLTADAAMRVASVDRYRPPRLILPLLGPPQQSSLFAAAGGAKVLAAVQTLPALAARQVRAQAASRRAVST